MISSAHGLLPAPGPATLELLRGLPVMGIDADTETVTPTGAAIVRTLGKQFASQPAMTIEKIGYGAGKGSLPNARIFFALSWEERIYPPPSKRCW
jgi:uncharacterized protein (DUF111 family)